MEGSGGGGGRPNAKRLGRWRTRTRDESLLAALKGLRKEVRTPRGEAERCSPLRDVSESANGGRVQHKGRDLGRRTTNGTRLVIRSRNECRGSGGRVLRRLRALLIRLALYCGYDLA